MSYNFLNNSIQNKLNIGYNNNFQIAAIITLKSVGLTMKTISLIIMFL